MAKTVLLIDGDQFLYRACVAVERETRWDDENHVLVANEAEAWDILSENLDEVLAHFGTREHVVALGEGERGDGKCFRYSIDPENYKAKRRGVRKPMAYHNVRARLIREYNVVTYDNLEADDVLGILATKPGKTDRIIVARDKDLKTIPGKLWDGKTFQQITEDEADYWHMYQTLVGDLTDGYKGCPGVGAVKATKLLDDTDWHSECGQTWPQAMWVKVLEAFNKVGLTEEDALRNARLARILRWSDWDSERKEVKLWEPNRLSGN